MNKTTMWQEINEQADVARDIIKNKESIKNAAAAMKEFGPQTVFFAARGSSEHACNYAKYLFEAYCGIPVVMAAPAVFTMYDGKLDLSHAATIAVTQCGAGKDLLEFVDRTNKAGGISIGVTNVADSPVAQAVQQNLDCRAGREVSVAATKSYLSQLVILTMLAAYYSGDEALLGVIDDIDKAIEAALAADGDIEKFAGHFKDSKSMFILGRGYDFGIATEAELKLQETCYIEARAYAGSDYYHGPYSLTKLPHENLLLVADDKTDGFMMELLKRMKGDGAVCYGITNDREKAAQFEDAIVLPGFCNGVLGAIAVGVVSQLLACNLAVLRGFNPDQPFGVGKVTITE